MSRSLAGCFLAFSSLLLCASACGDDEATKRGGKGQGGEAGETASAAGQGGGEDAGAGGAASASGCRPLTVGRPHIYFNPVGELSGLQYPVLDKLGDAKLPEYVLIELLDSTTPEGDGFLPSLELGDFDLTRAPNDSILTCQHCVSLVTDVNEAPDAAGFPTFQPTRWFFQRSGSLHLDEVHDPLSAALENSAFFGSVHAVELAELDLADPAQPFDPFGDCFYLAEAAFDTRPTPGAACQDLDDCGNELLEICDPTTLTCLDETQCDIDHPCETDAFCIQQYPLSLLGACYPRCSPFAADSCPTGQTCVQYGISEHDGYCLNTGDAQLGGKCEVKDTSTGCKEDAVCLGQCVAQCGFFSGSPECAAGSTCDVLGRCLTPAEGDAAKLGKACGAGAAVAAPCARNGSRFDGICFSYDGTGPLTCSKSCFVDADDYDGNADDGADDPDCAAEEFCAARFTSGLGICLPDPVCGDGDFGEVGEACDDHNQVNGDGCSADCQTVEYDVLCAAAPTLPLTGSVKGTTAGGLDGFLSSCQQGVSRGRIYTLAPPGPGQLELRLTSDTAQVLGLRSACDSADSELVCGNSFSDGDAEAPLLFQIVDPAPGPLTVVVNGVTLLDEGPFDLQAVFTPQVCGDGVKVGAEACDDGNQDGADGCSADCSSIEYDYWCDNAETLPLNKTITGDIDGSPHLFAPECAYGEGGDKLYVFTAPKAGTLTVSLDQTPEITTDLSLFVLDACAAPDTVTELGCSSASSPVDEVSVDVTKGQRVVVGVDGQLATAGQYSLSAKLE